MQDWPVEEKMPNSTPASATSRSASAKTMVGDLPPSSSETGISFAAAFCARARPTSVPPVKETLRMAGCVTSRSPTTPPAPGRTEKSPGGRPAASTMRASSRQTSGLQEAGLSSTALPAASAGATFCASEAMGEFQGVIPATTPSGSCTDRVIASPRCGVSASSEVSRSAAM